MECTGVAARWCPNCGTCRCPDREDLNDAACPLHGLRSPHAETEIVGQEVLFG